MSRQPDLDRACDDCWGLGVKQERERIIALLEEEQKQVSHPYGYYTNPLAYAIARIKGENE